MRALTLRLLLLSLSVAGASCGGDAASEPLIATTLVGSYDGFEFTPVNGFATLINGSGGIVVGDGNIACGSEDASSPPRGHNVSMRVPALEVGTYSNVFVNMYSNVNGFEGVGSNSGTVTITSVTDDSIVGSVSFDYTDDEDRQFSLSGTFEVAHCAY